MSMVFVVRVLPLSWQRGFRDGGAFRSLADGGVVLTAGVMAVLKPRVAARFVAVSLQKKDHRYGPHPRQVTSLLKWVLKSSDVFPYACCSLLLS